MLAHPFYHIFRTWPKRHNRKLAPITTWELQFIMCIIFEMHIWKISISNVQIPSFVFGEKNENKHIWFHKDNFAIFSDYDTSWYLCCILVHYSIHLHSSHQTNYNRHHTITKHQTCMSKTENQKPKTKHITSPNHFTFPIHPAKEKRHNPNKIFQHP